MLNIYLPSNFPSLSDPASILYTDDKDILRQNALNGCPVLFGSIANANFHPTSQQTGGVHLTMNRQQTVAGGATLLFRWKIFPGGRASSWGGSFKIKLLSNIQASNPPAPELLSQTISKSSLRIKSSYLEDSIRLLETATSILISKEVRERIGFDTSRCYLTYHPRDGDPRARGCSGRPGCT